MQNNTTQSLVLKLRFEDDIRRIRLDAPEDIPFEELQQLIGSLFVDVSISSIVLKYQDEDGDKLSITSTLEWKEAIRYFFTTGLPHFSLFLLQRAPATPQKSNSDDSLGNIAIILLKGALQGLGVDAELKEKEDLPNPSRVETRQHCHPHHVGGCRRTFGGGVCHRPPAVRARLCRRMQQPVDETAGCTYSSTGRRYAAHSAWFNCVTCGLVGMEGCCTSCANTCHKGHELINRGPCSSFFCDCGAGAHGVQCLLNNKNETESKDATLQRAERTPVVARLRLPSRYKQPETTSTTTPLIPLRIIKNEETLGVPSSSPLDVSESTEATEKNDIAVNNEETNENNVEAETSLEEKVECLVTMGFEDKEQNMAALVAHEGDLNSAILALLHN